MQVVDTSVLIAYLKGVPDARDVIMDPIVAGTVAASVLTRVEIEGGMRSAERRAVSQLMGSLRLVPVSDPIAARAGEYVRQYRRSHQGIDVVDYVIAATADVMGAEVVTLNVKHFPMFEGLRKAF